jgi:addiction module RelE/StbE family toxin
MPERWSLSWTGLALADLRSLRRYVARDKPAAAKALAERIRASVLRLRELPESGRIVPELQPRRYREVIVPPYRIVYEVRARKIVILRVWHGRQDLGRHE